GCLGNTVCSIACIEKISVTYHCYSKEILGAAVPVDWPKIRVYHVNPRCHL
ncbi:unnamed protein product, partial [Linum tenue]